MDFTLKTYKTLLDALITQGFSFQTFAEYLEYSKLSVGAPPIGGWGASAEKEKQKIIILRHDVDKLPGNSLRFAQIQHSLGIKGSYFFRIVPESFNTKIIEQIAGLGHEIGYHYEDVDLATQIIKTQVSRRKYQDASIKTQVSSFKYQDANTKAIEEKERIISEVAINLFEKHLALLREYYPVKTICMHGSPLSKYDNKLLWKFYNYRDYGIIGEPYFDIDFSNVFYLTDTGRRWNGEKVSIRDKVIQNSEFSSDSYRIQNLEFRKTKDLINAVNNGKLPDKIMFTFHPQRWTDRPLPWVKELVLQNVKNVIKYFLNKVR